ncbi:MAG: hypothetical protein ABC606_00845 [Candidatus Methanosuratincola petrocarbonis]
MPIYIQNYSMYDLIPITENYLLSQGLSVTVIANKVEGTRKTGFFSSEQITVLFDHYPDGCIVRIRGPPSICSNLENLLRNLPKREMHDPRVTVIKEREIVVMPCPYCKTLVRITESRYPRCGGSIISK